MNSQILSSKGRQLLLVDGYKFGFQKGLSGNKRRWQCTSRRTACKAYVKTEGAEEIITESLLDHNHDKCGLLNRQILSNNAKRAAVEDICEPPMKIIRNEMLMNDCGTLTAQDILRVRKNVYRARSGQLPKLPKSRQEFNDLIENQQTNKEPPSNMLEACRTCLRLIDLDNSPFHDIEADDVQLSTESCRFKLLSIVPEMALNITPKSMLCAECHWSLEVLSEFKEKCLRTENTITQYFLAKPDVDIKNIDLKEVSAFKAADISEDESIEASVEDVNIKEEVEFSDTAITIVKHEVDDFKSVEVARPNFPCEYCDTRCKNASSLKIHMRKHTGERPFRCETCDRSFAHKTNLTTHLRIHTGERPFLCTFCGKGFLKSSALKVHSLMHTGEKPYRCEVCDNRFTLKVHLNDHLRTHTGERPFKCNVCGRAYCSSGALKEHALNHSKVQPHQCEMCQKTFTRYSSLVFHRKKHSRPRSFECEHCKELFTHKQQLQRHVMAHKNERSYRCRICAKPFYMKFDVKRHILRVHRNADVDGNTVLVEPEDTSFVERNETENTDTGVMEESVYILS